MRFWKSKSADLETKSLSNPSPELLSVFGITSPTTITAERALTVPAVSAAIRLISEAAATLEIKVKKRDGAAEVDANDHPAAVLLRGQVNSWTSGFELVRDLTAQALISDNGGLAFVVKVRKQPREIVHYRPSFMNVDYDVASGEPSYKLDNQAVAAVDVIHVRGPFAKSPLNLALDAIATAKNLEVYVSGLFSSGAKPGGVLTSDKAMTDPALARLAAVWRGTFGGGENAGKTPILVDGVKFDSLAMKSTDAEFTINRTFQLNEIARAFRVPPSMLFEMSRATFMNAESMGREFLVYCLEPWLQALEAAFNRSLLTAAERAAGYRITFDRDDLTRADIGARATAYSSMISSRVVNPNEVRAWEGLPRYPDGDQFINPAISAAGDKTAGSDKPANDNKENSEVINVARAH